MVLEGGARNSRQWSHYQQRVSWLGPHTARRETDWSKSQGTCKCHTWSLLVWHVSN